MRCVLTKCGAADARRRLSLSKQDQDDWLESGETQNEKSQLYTGCLLDAFLGRCSRHVPPGGGPGNGTGHAGGTMSLGCPGNDLSSPRRSWSRCLGLSAESAAPATGSRIKRKTTSFKSIHPSIFYTHFFHIGLQ
ncbi:hypothetical protein CHARACLAT_015761 [Characodon lateralis]|uniref:Uncharacterized protein n=1 Tax=Characodon lateralis TaxID=208331 RepID=A0ABU7D1E8_9TELE|nr:hypothetical protein [Characodon lateralis]